MAERIWSPVAVLFLGILAISWSAVFVRLCDAPAAVIAVYRLGLSVIILLPGALCARRSATVGFPRGSAWWIALSGLCLGLHFITWIEAVQRVPVVVAVTLSSTHPIFVAVLSRLLLGERFGGLQAVGAALAVLGSTGMGWAGGFQGSGEWEGYACAVGSALFFSGYMIAGRKLRRTMDLLSYVVPTYATAGVLLGLGAAATGLSLVGYSGQTFLMFLLLAVVPTAIGHSSLNFALGHVSATLVAVSVLGEPIGATLLAALLLGEIPGPLKIVSGLVILTGIFVTTRGSVATIPRGEGKAGK
jgi:drug/metabolite transporter (DMT)-like permease